MVGVWYGRGLGWHMVGVCGMGVAWVGIWLVCVVWAWPGLAYGRCVVWAWPGLAYGWCVWYGHGLGWHMVGVWYGRGLGWHMVGVCGMGVCRVDMVGVFPCAAVALVDLSLWVTSISILTIC